jgi:hypothetical protein
MISFTEIFVYMCVISTSVWSEMSSHVQEVQGLGTARAVSFLKRNVLLELNYFPVFVSSK